MPDNGLALQLGVQRDQGGVVRKVILDFSDEPISRIEMEPEDARNLAHQILDLLGTAES